MNNSIMLEESLNFSINAISFYEHLVSNNEYILANQFLRSATSIGANLRESRYAESKKDFLHKLTIAMKECNETLYWLELLKHRKKTNIDTIDRLYTKCSVIFRMLSAAIKTTKQNLNSR